ncbi:MAG: (2Fe-2S)-binding protein [Planctomycetales bacterium]|nr:(2Fe-2S)-binding protein [Planctomycetales bacterium]
MARVIIDSVEIEIGDDERLNGIQAAARAGIDIPRYCWHPGLSVVASCRMCLVETGTRNVETGDVVMLPKLVPACQTPARDGTVFITQSDKVQHSRAMVEEDLLIDHPIDCPICDKAGECYLQDYYFKYGHGGRRADVRPFTSRRRDVGPTVTLFTDRCVMCTRCVRFTREISGTSELMVRDRGAHEEIDIFSGFPLENKLAGNVVDICPVGALGDKDFLYQQRVWFMKRHEAVCTGCSTGCSIYVEENQDRVYRLKPRENEHVNQWWMCDEGRYGYHYVHSPKRVVGAQRRVETSEENGDNVPAYENVEWQPILDDLQARLAKAGRLAAVFSPHLTVEEAYLLAKLVHGVDAEATLAIGPVPVVGEDESYPNGFTIRAEKCPNHRGLQLVLSHFTDRVLAFDQFLEELPNIDVGATWVTGGYPQPWIDEASASRFDEVPLLIMQDIFASPLWERASYRLPGVAFAARPGSYVNHRDRLQTADWAIRPPAGARVEGSVYWQMLGMSGLYRPQRVLDEIAATVPAFAMAAGPLPSVGVDLRLNQFAEAATAAASETGDHC